MDQLDLGRVPRDLGAGVGLRREHYASLPTTDRRLDWVEVIPENFIGWEGRTARALGACADRWPVLPHGTSLDLGGLDPLDEGFLSGVAELCQRLDAPFWSDHLCFSRVNGVWLHDLVPVPFSREAVRHVVARLREARARVGRPFLLENPSYYVLMPGSEMSEAELLTRVVEEADCGLLLDINNVYVNARNHGYDPLAFLDAIPLERVRQVHLAGHDVRPEAIIDTHGAAVPEPVWALYQELLQRIGPVSTLVEWDQNIPSQEALLDQADRARALLDASRGAPLPETARSVASQASP